MTQYVRKTADDNESVWTGQTVGAPSSTGFITANSTNTTHLPFPPNAMGFSLKVLGSASSTSGTLNVAIQTRLRGSSDYVDVLAFTQIANPSTAIAFHFGKICADSTMATFSAASSLAAGGVRHMLGDEWRVRYTATAATSTVNWTCEVTAIPM